MSSKNKPKSVSEMLNAPVSSSPTALNELSFSSRELVQPSVSLRDQIICSVIQSMLSSLCGQFTSEAKFDRQMDSSRHAIRLAIRVALEVGNIYDEIRGEYNDVQPQSSVEASEGESEERLGE